MRNVMKILETTSTSLNQCLGRMLVLCRGPVRKCVLPGQICVLVLEIDASHNSAASPNSVTACSRLLVSPKGRLAPWRTFHVCTAIALNDYLPFWETVTIHATHAYFTSPGLEDCTENARKIAQSTCWRNRNLRDCSQNPVPSRAHLQGIRAS